MTVPQGEDDAAPATWADSSAPRAAPPPPPPTPHGSPDPGVKRPPPDPEDGADPMVDPTGTTAADLLIGALDGTLRHLARRPVSIRVRSAPLSLARGRLDTVVVELRQVPLTSLVVERMVVRAEGLRIDPGLPPHLRADSVGFKVTVGQTAVDRWVRASHLPVRILLRPDGIALRAGVRRFTVSEVTAELAVKGPFVRLRPTSAGVLGLRTNRLPPVPGYLPLPPLPAGAKLTRVDHADGAITVWFDLGAIDEPITPSLARRLARRLTMPQMPWGR